MTLILVRHGESEWNRAQKENDLLRMARTCDHPLNATGIRQALALAAVLRQQQQQQQQRSNVHQQDDAEPPPRRGARAGDGDDGGSGEGDGATSSVGGARPRGAGRRQPPTLTLPEAEAQMRGARQLYSSPSTRALQTAMVGLATLGSPSLPLPPVVLLTSAREVKDSVLGMDNVGIEVGEAVRARAVEEAVRRGLVTTAFQRLQQPSGLSIQRLGIHLRHRTRAHTRTHTQRPMMISCRYVPAVNTCITRELRHPGRHRNAAGSPPPRAGAAGRAGRACRLE
jgi:hypothetical protein